MWGYLWSPDQLSLVLLQPVPHLQCSAQECILIDVNFITAPPPPTEFACNGSSIYNKSMTLTWKEPATPNGYIENYIIYDATRNMSIPTNGSVLKQLIGNLSPGRKNVGFFSAHLTMWDFVKFLFLWNKFSHIDIVSFLHFFLLWNRNLKLYQTWVPFRLYSSPHNEHRFSGPRPKLCSYQ